MKILFSLIALAPALSLGATTALQCGRLVDVRALQVLEQRTIVVEDQRIARVASGFEAPAGATVVDLRSQTCMPGLIDLHVHFDNQLSPAAYFEGFQLNPPDYAVRAVVNARKTLMAGFTSVRELGSAPGVSTAVRNAINRGIVPGPRIQAAGFLTSTGGHGDPTNGLRSDLVGHPGEDQGIINGPDEARRAVRQKYKEGYDLIKIATTGGVLSLSKSADAPLLADAELAAIVATARDYGFPVACHAHGAEGMKRAIRAGVTSIEHGTYMDDEAMALMKRHGTWYVPTISAGKFVEGKAKVDGYFPEIVRPKAAAVGPQILGTFSRAYKAGVKIAFGTDQGVAVHGENAREFEFMVEGGMPPLETLRAATLYAATVMGWDDRLGTLEPGKLADIVAVPDDPRRDISTMSRVSFVMKDGAVVRGPGR
jgi:imidazolonepropionase-like amidohydrolase